jgi:hypothetical protein
VIGVCKIIVEVFFCFVLISQWNISKAQRGATLSSQGVYKEGLGGRGEEREKIRKTNHPWGQLVCCPGE